MKQNLSRSFVFYFLSFFLLRSDEKWKKDEFSRFCVTVFVGAG